MRPASSQGGFVLPVAMLVLVMLSIVGATVLFAARSDFRAARDAREAAVALAAADAGAARTVALWGQVVPALPAPGDSLDLGWKTLPDGSLYRVVLYRAPTAPLDPPPASVVVYTTGRVRPPGDARRSIAMVVEPGGGVGSVDVCCDAAVTLGGRLDVSGAPGPADLPAPELDGADRAPPTWAGAICPEAPADGAGVVVSDPQNVREMRNGDIAGAPPVEADPTLTPAAFTDLEGGVTYQALAAAATKRFTGNQTLAPAPTVAGGECDRSDPTNWGSPLTPGALCGDYRPLIHVAGDLTLTGAGQGQGVLLVDGDLRVEQGAAFYGLVIVLGTLDVRQGGELHGGVMVRGGADGTGRSSVRGPGGIRYSSCAVRRAQEAVGGGSGATELEWFEVIG